MNTLFSPFTLLKPYFKIIYDLWQPIQLIKGTSNTCLEKEV
jgi:hypothetical protein